MKSDSDVTTHPKSMIGSPEQERASISIVGRALTEQEMHRLDQVEGALPPLTAAVEIPTADFGFSR